MPRKVPPHPLRPSETGSGTVGAGGLGLADEMATASLGILLGGSPRSSSEEPRVDAVGPELELVGVVLRAVPEDHVGGVDAPPVVAAVADDFGGEKNASPAS